MNAFLKNIVIFVAVGVIIILLLLMFRIMRYSPYILDESINTIVVGDSKTKLSINDKYLEKSQNISLHSEHYFYSYFKIKEIISNNPSIDHVILGFAHHNLSSYFDTYIIGKKANSTLINYFDLIDVKSLIYLIKKNPKIFFLVLKISISNSDNDYPYIGSFAVEDPTQRNPSVRAIRKRLDKQFFNEDEVRVYSKYNLDYLYKIVEFCKKNDVKLTLLTTPHHPMYLGMIPKEYQALYENTLEDLKIPHIDLSGFELNNSDYLPDGDHIKQKAVEAVTKEMQKQFYGIYGR